MSEYRITQEYACSPERVWRAVTDPALVPRWTSTGKGGRPEGFAPIVGTRFRYIAKPMPGWNGVVECEVLEARAPSLLRYTWQGDANDDVTTVTYRIEASAAGARFTWEHTGFRGIGGFIVCKILASVRRTMLAEGLRLLLTQIDDAGRDHAYSASA